MAVIRAKKHGRGLFNDPGTAASASVPQPNANLRELESAPPILYAELIREEEYDAENMHHVDEEVLALAMMEGVLMGPAYRSPASVGR